MLDFPSIISIIDETFNILVYKPTKHGEDYDCKKMFYSISTTMVRDHVEKIIHI
jgi:hypothetical protein